MPIIRNNLNSRILIQLKGGKSIDLLEKNTVEITDDDLLSSHLQDLIQRGFVITENEAKREVEESGKEGKVETPKKDKEVKKEADEDLSTEKETKKEADEDLSKEKEVKKEADENSAQKKSNNTKKGK